MTIFVAVLHKGAHRMIKQIKIHELQIDIKIVLLFIINSVLS